MTDEPPKFKVIQFKKKEDLVDEEEEIFTPDMMLDKAKGTYKLAIVLGWDTEEELSYMLSKGVTAPEAMLLLELVKTDLLNNMFDD